MSQMTLDFGKNNKPIRLIQYLGSKLRSIEFIVPEIKKIVPEKGIIIDLFAGTTVVGSVFFLLRARGIPINAT